MLSMFAAKRTARKANRGRCAVSWGSCFKTSEPGIACRCRVKRGDRCQGFEVAKARVDHDVAVLTYQVPDSLCKHQGTGSRPDKRRRYCAAGYLTVPQRSPDASAIFT